MTRLDAWARETAAERFARKWRSCGSDAERAGFLAEVRISGSDQERQWAATFATEAALAKRKGGR